MRKPLKTKVRTAIRRIREAWPRLAGKHRFIAFSTGKDSLALAAMVYEAVGSQEPKCLYVHHDLEFPVNLEYLAELRRYGFNIETLQPFLQYFELIERGIGFITLKDPWCVPMLVGTDLLEWLKHQDARSPREGVMFRGISGGEYSHKWHAQMELYKRLDLPCFNPLLDFGKDEILEIIRSRYGLPLNPIYEHMDRTYCICCYTSDARRQAYSTKHFPEVCERYYAHVERMLFPSGLVAKSHIHARYKTRHEKLKRHGFAHWRRVKAQDVVGAIKRRLSTGVVAYTIREADWVRTKHLRPVRGHWARNGREIRFWGLSEKITDVIIRRMINCLDCGFCMVECFPCRRFDRETKALQIEGCIQCGKCLRLKFCMGWRHRFWRRVIMEESTRERQKHRLPVSGEGASALS